MAGGGLRNGVVPFCLAALLAVTPVGGRAVAQQVTPVLTVNQEALFLRSAFGQRIRDDIARASEELAAENRVIEADLMAEEQSLTERRRSMSIEDFRAEAEAFDSRVVAIRSEQDAKTRAINRAGDEGQQVFFARVAEILSQLMRERGAVAILDERVVFLAADVIDITEAAIARIDAAIGSGVNEATEPPAPVPDQD